MESKFNLNEYLTKSYYLLITWCILIKVTTPILSFSLQYFSVLGGGGSKTFNWNWTKKLLGKIQGIIAVLSLPSLRQKDSRTKLDFARTFSGLLLSIDDIFSKMKFAKVKLLIWMYILYISLERDKVLVSIYFST